MRGRENADQAINRTAPRLPKLPPRRSHDHVRNGTTSLFAALDVATGHVIASYHRQHRHQEFLKFLKTIDAATPAELDLHLICDNYTTHKTQAVKKWLLRYPRVPRSLHSGQLQLAQSRGTVVLRANQPQTAPLRPPQRPRTRSRFPRLDRRLEHRPPAVRLDQDRRRDPGQPSQISSAN